MANNSHQKDAIDRACSMKEELMERIERLGDKLPPNTLDQLIDELGGPENVAEVSFKTLGNNYIYNNKFYFNNKNLKSYR